VPIRREPRRWWTDCPREGQNVGRKEEQTVVGDDTTRRSTHLQVRLVDARKRPREDHPAAVEPRLERCVLTCGALAVYECQRRTRIRLHPDRRHLAASSRIPRKLFS
jgi:hypothetical protein